MLAKDVLSAAVGRMHDPSQVLPSPRVLRLVLVVHRHADHVP